MKDKLRSRFLKYIGLATSHLGGRSATIMSEDGEEPLRVSYVNPSYWLRSAVEDIESSVEFNNLVSDVSVAFGDRPLERLETGSVVSGFSVSLPRYHVQNFLRRSRLYIHLFDGDSISPDSFFDMLWNALHQRVIKITSLRLIDNVEFHETFLDFGTFRIQQFSKEDLDKLIDNPLNHIFYPRAEVDTEILSQYWFIVEESRKEFPRVNFREWEIDYPDPFEVSRTFPDRVIQLLSLFDWENLDFSPAEIERDLGWSSLSAGKIWLTITDDIFKSPAQAPDLSSLLFQPVFDERGEEAGEYPAFIIHFDPQIEDRFKKVIGKSQRFLDIVDMHECDWEFLSRAMGYLSKASLTDGLEQLLWHITVLEVLVGEKDAVTDSLRRRIGIVLGDNDNVKIEGIRKRINELYEFRSKLVHGGPLLKGKRQQKIYLGHLRRARRLARNVLYWFIKLLSYIHSDLNGKAISLNQYPKREEFLFLIDYHLKSLVGKFGTVNLPESFPMISDDD